MDVQPYEEKLMLYMLFTGTFLPEHETVYQNLAECETEELLLRAYETWFSWQYMIGKNRCRRQLVYICVRSLQKNRFGRNFAEQRF